MPIKIDDLSTFVPLARSVTPKFFHKDVMTGAGKTTGLINQNLRPGRYLVGEGPHTTPVENLAAKTKNSGGDRTVYTIPTAPLTPYSVKENASRNLTFKMPAADEMFHITSHASSLNYDAYLALTPQGVVVTKDGSGDKIITEARVGYRMELYVVPVGTLPERVPMHAHAPHRVQGDGYVMIDYSFGPLDDAEDFVAKHTARIASSAGGTYMNIDDLAEWMSEYDVHENICAQAEQWSSMDIADIMCDHITELFASGTPDDKTLNRLTSQLRYLETYPVALEAYRAIHGAIMTAAPADVSSVLVKQNINLLMNHTLQELADLKDQLPVPPQTGSVASLDPRFSTQQRNIVITDEPLVLVQAGAGTGKSTTILARIKHLVEDRGVDPSEITVLSFTNAAADNITEKNPLVNSMTIARMIHDIYTLNHPTHELSSVETIVNSLEIEFPGNPLAQTFQRRLLEMEGRRKVSGATTALNAFVEHYRKDVIDMLDKIGQTCLELEIILAYQQIDTMIEPAHVQSKYLIVDEVQDNSVFEFIYTLKYTAKHKENLFMVGDASQSLYEFRASNPKALNALEGSGVFTCFQLTTNYRSQQGILDFANVGLRSVEANQIAQIQLKANSLAATTAKEFTEQVTLDYRWYQRIREFNDDLPGYLRAAKPWIDDRLARGEQVAFLAYSRNNVMAMEKALQKIYPNELVANLTSEKGYSTTVFSEFVKKHWDEVRQVPDLSKAAFAVTQGIKNNLHTLVTGDVKKAQAPIMKMVSDWWIENASTVNVWVSLTKQTNAQTGQPLMGSDEFFENLKQSLLKFEVSRNAIRQSLLNQRKNEKKKEQLAAGAKIVVSTIHGAKGLEFDHVFGIYQFEPQMSEPNKRMYYVMLTRAIKSEYVLAYGTLKKPKIEADYEMIVNTLQQREQMAILRAQGYDLDVISDDEAAAALALLKQQADEAMEAGDLDKASSLVPTPVDYSTRGADLPARQDDDVADTGDDDGTSAFTAPITA